MPLIRRALDRIVLQQDAIVLWIEPAGLRNVLLGDTSNPVTALSVTPTDSSRSIQYRVPAEIRLRRSGARKLAIGNEASARTEPDPVLLKTIARAYVWAEMLKDGAAESVREIARTEGVTEST